MRSLRMISSRQTLRPITMHSSHYRMIDSQSLSVKTSKRSYSHTNEEVILVIQSISCLTIWRSSNSQSKLPMNIASPTPLRNKRSRLGRKHRSKRSSQRSDRKSSLKSTSLASRAKFTSLRKSTSWFPTSKSQANQVTGAKKRPQRRLWASSTTGQGTTTTV